MAASESFVTLLFFIADATASSHHLDQRSIWSHVMGDTVSDTPTITARDLTLQPAKGRPTVEHHTGIFALGGVLKSVRRIRITTKPHTSFGISKCIDSHLDTPLHHCCRHCWVPARTLNSVQAHHHCWSNALLAVPCHWSTRRRRWQELGLAGFGCRPGVVG